VDIPVVNLSVGVTLDGAPLSAANTGDFDEGVIKVRDTTTGEVVNFGDIWNDGTDMVLAPYSVQLVVGDYDFLYSVVDDGPNWPRNADAVLEAAVPLLTDGAITLDIPVVNLSVGVTLDGAPLSAANTGDFDEGVIKVRDTTTGEVVNFGDIWNDGTDMVLAPYSVQLVAGDYDFLYSVVDDGPNWPRNANAVLDASVLLVSDGAVVVNIPVVNLSVGVTLDGAPLSAANTGDFDEGVIKVRDTTTSEVVNFGDIWNDGTDMVLAPYSVQLVAGDYDFLYSVVDDGPNWPRNSNAVLVSAVQLMSDGAVTVDIPVVNLSVDVTLDGAPLSASNTGDFDEGVIKVRDLLTDEIVNFGDIWNDGTDMVLAPYSVQLVAGSYEFRYGVVDDGASWPRNADAPLQCVVLQ
jgi:hypothetical protein